jgi:CubicO group peptidase (beta-lactamase class C family)
MLTGDAQLLPLRRRLATVALTRTAANVLQAMLFMFLVEPLASAAEPGVEQRVWQVENELLPPVLVKGETLSKSTLSERMQVLHVPGVSVAVIHRGKIEWARGFGVTKEAGAAVNPHTLFQAASISKAVATVVVMKLIQAGKIDFSADANQYLKVWKIPSSSYTDERKVSVLDLVTHTSGITDNYFPGYVPGTTLPTLVQMLNGDPPANNKPVRVDTLPGTSWRYSGGNFLVVQALLNDATETDFQELARDSVFAPYGMRESTFAFPLPAELAGNAAIAYRSDGEPVIGGPRVHPESATAGLWSTPSDLARFSIGIQGALSGRDKRVISPSTARLMLTPIINQQAIGFTVGGRSSLKYFSHWGVNYGYRAFLVAYEKGDGAIVMTNSDNGETLIQAIVRTIAFDYGWPDYAPTTRILNAIDPKAFDRNIGAYRLPSGGIVTFWRDGIHIEVHQSGQPVFEIFPTSELEYFYKTVDARWVFSSNLLHATLFQNDQEQTAKRLDDPDGKLAVEFSIAEQRRFKDQQPAAESAAALRRLITGLASGTPNYDEMAPA